MTCDSDFRQSIAFFGTVQLDDVTHQSCGATHRLMFLSRYYFAVAPDVAQVDANGVALRSPVIKHRAPALPSREYS
ncbi:hypothetical protein [Neorhodopirellula lusitana]|uniref:hypothetical protein n=1 Tax=Neorhodopirellula lusitana TaxID=445327 RepID=UPI0024B6F1C3|nr:hypothetical protein [Neorhodopirellula lusitana]